MDNSPKKKTLIGTAFVLLLIIVALVNGRNSNQRQRENSYHNNTESNLNTREFNILASEENRDLEKIVRNYANAKGYDISIDYAGTLDIMNKLNKGEEYDCVWTSNSIWSYMVDSKVASLKDAKSTSITPVIFGITKSKAEELGFVGKTVYTKDIVDAISSGKLKFTMSNPTTTNSGASAYLGMLYTLAGNPEVLTDEILNKQEVREKLKTFFSGLERTAGTEDFLEQTFLNGNYEAVVSYESSIIKINKQLESMGREPLYAIYPVDGVSICDNPIAYIDHKNESKKTIFEDIKSYLLSNEGQKLLQKEGRRTWFGGINPNADQTIFNPEWGIDTTKYITPVKYPSTSVIKHALIAYQERLRKPIHVVFCLDYSGSMKGTGIEELKKAMDYILTDKASADYIQFSSEDKIDIIPFANTYDETWSTESGTGTANLLYRINSKSPYGGTALYGAAAKGISILKSENLDLYNVSVILMTDGEGNVGKESTFISAYENANKDIPVYSIMFGEADSTQLEGIAGSTNAKVFDGKSDLVQAFKEVRGYN